MKGPMPLRRLRLDKQTVRKLDGRDLRRVNGGGLYPTFDCAAATQTRICGEAG